MFARINIPRRNVVITEDPLNFNPTVKIAITDMETLDNIIEQCRNIKLNLLEANTNGQL